MLLRVESTLTVFKAPSAYLVVWSIGKPWGEEVRKLYSFCASMITRVEFSTVAFEGPTPTRERKDFASDIFR
jgi:hypothetical protein